MKKIIAVIILLTFALCMGLQLAKAQTNCRTCTPTVVVSCAHLATATVSSPNQNWRMQLTQGASVIETAVVQPDGVTFNFTTLLTDSLDYAVTYFDASTLSLGCGYSTRFLAIGGRTTKDCTSGNCCVTENPCTVIPITPAAPTGGPGNSGNARDKKNR